MPSAQFFFITLLTTILLRIFLVIIKVPVEIQHLIVFSDFKISSYLLFIIFPLFYSLNLYFNK